MRFCLFKFQHPLTSIRVARQDNTDYTRVVSGDPFHVGPVRADICTFVHDNACDND